MRALTLESNKRNYGPFGVEQGTYFAFPKVQGRIVGFLGKSGWYVDSIGAYIEPLHEYQVTPNQTYYSQQNVSHAMEDKFEYSVIQGSLGTNYDLIVAVRQKDDRASSKPVAPSPRISHDYSSSESKVNQVYTFRKWLINCLKIHKHVLT